MQQDVQNRLEMLDSIVASLKGYPTFGGDVGVMKEVERLRREAKIEALEWARAVSELGADGGAIREEILRLRGENNEQPH